MWGLAHDIGGPAGDDLDLAAGGKVHAGRAGAYRLEYRWMGFLQRLGHHQQVVHVGELAVVGKPLFRPGFDDHVYRFREPLPALLHIHADTVEFLPLVTGADAEVEPSAADDVQHGRFFGHQYGIMQRQDDHRSADADARGAGGDRAQEREYPGKKAVA